MKTVVFSMIGLFCLSIATPSFAAGRIFTAQDRVGMCARTSGRDLLRCEARQKAKEEHASKRGEIPDDPLRGGRVRLQNKEASARTVRNAERLSRRKTFREYRETSDLNTRRRTFLNAHRSQQLTCMLMLPGRRRRLCLQKEQNDIRALMDPANALEQ